MPIRTTKRGKMSNNTTMKTVSYTYNSNFEFIWVGFIFVLLQREILSLKKKRARKCRYPKHRNFQQQTKMKAQRKTRATSGSRKTYRLHLPHSSSLTQQTRAQSGQTCCGYYYYLLTKERSYHFGQILLILPMCNNFSKRKCH